MIVSIRVEGHEVKPKRTFVLEALSKTRSEFKNFLQDIYLDTGHPVEVYELNAAIDVSLSMLIDLRKTNRRKFKIGRAINVLQKYQALMRKKCRHANLAWKYYMKNWAVESNAWTERMLVRAHDPELVSIWTTGIDETKASDWVLNPDNLTATTVGPKSKPVDIIVNMINGNVVPVGSYDYTVSAVRTNSSLRKQ